MSATPCLRRRRLSPRHSWTRPKDASWPARCRRVPSAFSLKARGATAVKVSSRTVTTWGKTTLPAFARVGPRIICNTRSVKARWATPSRSTSTRTSTARSTRFSTRGTILRIHRWVDGALKASSGLILNFLSQNSDRDRIVWTYNAPVAQSSNNSNQQGVVVSPTSHSSSISTSPQHTDSPASPTSVSSSVMSSSGSKGNGLSHTANGGVHGLMFLSGEQSVSEAISNISSPDYQDEHDLLSTRDLSAAMAISDPSDSDSTLIVDNLQQDKDHKVVIQVAATEANILKDSEDELATLTDEPMMLLLSNQRESSPPISEDGSDVESLHSFHYSPKAVDIPSAVRLAKRLYHLDGFKKSDVSRHLSKKWVRHHFRRSPLDLTFISIHPVTNLVAR